MVKTVIEAEGPDLTPVRVFHRNQSNKAWVHPYAERTSGTCLVCSGESTAAPPERG